MIMPIELSLLKDAVVRYGSNLLKLVEEFTGAKPATVARWLNSESPPVGEYLLKLRVFLSMIGFAPADYASLPMLGKQLAEAIALNAVTADEVQTELGYTEKTAILSIVLRGRSMLPDKAFRLEELLKRQQPTIDENRNFWHEMLRTSNLATLPENLTPSCSSSDSVEADPVDTGPSDDSETDEGGTSTSDDDADSRESSTVLAVAADLGRLATQGFGESAEEPATANDAAVLTSLDSHAAVRIALSLVDSLKVTLDVIANDPQADELLRAIGLATGHGTIKEIITTLLRTHAPNS